VARTTAVRPKTGLASLFPEELKLTGVVWDPKGYYALVEAPNGLGYVVRTNDVLGDDARVTRITPEGMVLEMPEQSDIPRPGGGHRRVLEIKLRKEEDR
jgi:Tfp pilus assembly protein PilP